MINESEELRQQIKMLTKIVADQDEAAFKVRCQISVLSRLLLRMAICAGSVDSSFSEAVEHLSDWLEAVAVAGDVAFPAHAQEPLLGAANANTMREVIDELKKLAVEVAKN